MMPKRLLLMEDDRSFSMLLQRQLERLGYLVDLAEDGVIGLEKLEAATYDLLLLDYHMPRLDGLGVLRALKLKPDAPPTIMLSANTEIEVGLTAMRLGAADFLVKQTDSLESIRLQAAIDHALERHHLRLALEASNQRLRESEEKFRAITENTTDITFILGKDRIFRYVSPSVRQICGYEPREIEGQGPKTFIHSEDLPALKHVLERAWSQPGKTCPTPDFRVLFRDGGWYHFNGKVTALPETPGVEGLVVSCRDISKRKQAETALLYEKLRFEKYLATTGTILLALNTRGEIQLVNPQGLKLLQTTEEAVLDQAWTSFIPPEEQEPMNARFQQLLRREVTQLENLEGRVITTSGEERVVSWCLNPIEEKDRIIELLLSGIDITDRKRAEAALAKSEERYELATQAAKVGVWDWDLRLGEMYMDPYLKQALGYRDDELANHPQLWRSHLHPQDCQRVIEALDACIHGMRDYVEVEHRMVCRDGRVHWYITRARSGRDEEGNVVRLTGTDTEITELKLVELKIEHMASHDSLTSLPNRVLLQDRLKMALATARRERNWVGVLFMDLDGFKPINDTYGHDAGDHVLRTIADRLSALVRGSDTVARFGGDEFILVLSGITGHADVERVCQKVLLTVQDPIEPLPGCEVQVSASIGVALSPVDGDTPEQLIKAADTAMYLAKALGKNRFRFAQEISPHA